MATVEQRREELKDVYRRARVCERCPHLVATRTQVVFGAGNANADLMFIGEAPGRDEDLNGIPFVGRSGKLLTSLLEEVGLSREDVFIANVLKCRPPDNRNPNAGEIENCRDWLEAQLELIQPRVVCTLGNFATRLIRDRPEGITRVRGQAEVVTIGPRRVRLLPLLHPAAALYTPSNVDLLRADIGLIPGLLALDEPVQPESVEPPAAVVVAEAAVAEEAAATPEPVASPPEPVAQPPEPVEPAAEPLPGEVPPAEATPPTPPDQLGLF